VIALAGLFLVLAIVPLSWVGGLFPCAVKQFIRVDCPGCGLLRSWAHLVHFDWRVSFDLYPLGPLIFLGLLLYTADEVRVIVGADRAPIIRPLIASQWILLLPGLIFLQWIAKLVGLW
jgi:hypothetical protein